MRLNRLPLALMAGAWLAAAAAQEDKKPEEAPKAPPREEARKGKIFRHVIGFRFWYPESWTVQDHTDFLQIIPEKPESNENGPTEFYFVIGESVADEGITDPGDRRVVEYIDQQVKSIAPFLQFTGKTEKAGKKGVLLQWKGNNPRGEEVVSKSYVCILKDHGVSLAALGFPKPLEKRAEDLVRIFDSFGLEEGKRDAAVVGAWDLTSVHSIVNRSPFETDWSRAQAVKDVKSRMEFRADGTWKRTDQEHLLVGAGGIWLEDKSNKVSEGTWFAGDGKICILYKDDSWSDWGYRMEGAGPGRKLRLATGRRGEVWAPAE